MEQTFFVGFGNRLPVASGFCGKSFGEIEFISRRTGKLAELMAANSIRNYILFLELPGGAPCMSLQESRKFILLSPFPAPFGSFTPSLHRRIVLAENDNAARRRRFCW
ncbi:MAG: hypothetical protein Q4D27_02905 [Coriobacteriia bacterium]|nr:hypothetical protein [Coriobacteriia bacterium]